MTEYIDRKEAIRVLSNPITMSMCVQIDECKFKRQQRETDLELIKSLHTADVQPVKWIPVTERLPERFETVIICGRMKYSFEKDYCRFVDVACFDKPYKEKCQDKWSIFNDWYEGQQEYEITHWMPLPKPPKEEWA